MRAEPTGPDSWRALRAANSPATTLWDGKIHLWPQEKPSAVCTAGFTSLSGAKNIPWLLSHQTPGLGRSLPAPAGFVSPNKQGKGLWAAPGPVLPVTDTACP